MDKVGLFVMLCGALGPSIGDLFKAGDARDCLVGISMVKSSLFLLSSIFANVWGMFVLSRRHSVVCSKAVALLACRTCFFG